MDQPTIRYYLDGRIQSDWVEVDGIEARIQKLDDNTLGWVDRSGVKLEHLPVLDHGQKADRRPEEGGQGDERIQGGNSSKRQARPRQGSKGKKP